MSLIFLYLTDIGIDQFKARSGSRVSVARRLGLERNDPGQKFFPLSCISKSLEIVRGGITPFLAAEKEKYGQDPNNGHPYSRRF